MGRVLLEIRGHDLPGRSWHLDERPCRNVHVGIQRGREAVDLVPGDSLDAVWTLEVEVRELESGPDFRGPEVQGRRGERFVYLTWGDVGDDEAFTMFRRAKLMLDDVLAVAGTDRVAARVVAEVALTDERGGPRCARLRPPALALRSA